MPKNYFEEEKKRRVDSLIRILKEAKEKGKEVSIMKLRNVFFEDFGVSPNLLDKYIHDLERMGIVKSSTNARGDIIEYTGQV